MRNKDVAIGRQTIFNNYEPLYTTLTHPDAAVPVSLWHALKATLCMPSGSTSLSTAPAEGRAERGERYKLRNEEASAITISLN